MTNWQKKLGTVDLVLSTWQDVQRKWQALESIFVGSADIRVQLPEDSKRFETTKILQWITITRDLFFCVSYPLTSWQWDVVKSTVTFFSCRFDVINADFQDLMKSAPETTNTVEACNMEGRQVNRMLAVIRLLVLTLLLYLIILNLLYENFKYLNCLLRVRRQSSQSPIAPQHAALIAVAAVIAPLTDECVIAGEA